jgi:thioredoxin-related protein
MKRLLIFMAWMPYSVNAQHEKGIKFDQNLTWQEIRVKAKAENKYIFVDCFATWCGPCKAMDNDTYQNEKVGNFVNDKFISVKVQEDTSAKDNKQVKNWYADAHDIMRRYKVVGLPTFLFFSPDAKIVHRDMGYKDTNEFIALVARASNPSEQYYTLLENYKRGIKDYLIMPYLIRTSLSLKENNIANIIKQDYLHHYLYRLNEEELYSRENLQFMYSAVDNTKERGFWIFYQHSDKVDQVMKKKGYSKAFVDYIITKEEIDRHLFKNGKPITDYPNWDNMSRTISRKYSISYAERDVLNAQIRWYKYKGNWPVLVKYDIMKIDRYGLDTTGFWGKDMLNDMIYDVVFKHCNDTVILNKAVKWMEMLVQVCPNDIDDIDTYANLLYKLGRTQDALQWEEKAAASGNKEILSTVEKMKMGIHTW